MSFSVSPWSDVPEANRDTNRVRSSTVVTAMIAELKDQFIIFSIAARHPVLNLKFK